MPRSKLLLSRLPLGGIWPRWKTSAQKKKLVLLAFKLSARLSPFSLKEVLPMTHPWCGRSGGPWPVLVFGGMSQFSLLSAGTYHRLGSCPPAFIKNLQALTAGWALVQTNLHLLLSTAQNPTEITFFILSLVKMMLSKQGTWRKAVKLKGSSR